MKRLIRMIILSFFTLAVLVVSSYAWFTNSQFVEPNISGYSVAAYFGGGDGSTSAPFKIKNQRHLYNLAWLQYLGYFNKKGSGIVENTNANTLTHYSFSIENDINMDGWKLPPIGTSYNPFIGSLNGNGHTISNLETTNDFDDLDKHPGTVDEYNFGNKKEPEFLNSNSNSCSVIGFIGSIGQTTNMHYAGLGITAPTFTNLVLNNNTVSTSTAETLVGSVAGYVNGTISDVGVRIPTLNVNTNAAVSSLSSKTSNLSDFAVVGYAEDTYTTALTKRTTTIYNPTTSYSHFSYNGMGNTTEWGGSIDMSALYTKINTFVKYQDTYKVNNYVKNEINYYDAQGTLLSNKTIQVTGQPSRTHYYGSTSDGSGAYLTQNYPTYNGYDYLTALYKEVIVVKETGTTNGYKIKSPNGSYLNITSTRTTNTTSFNTTISTSTATESATVWIQEGFGLGFVLYTYNPDDGNKYYLTTTNYQNLSLSITTPLIWSYSSEDGYYITNNSNTYYLRFINGTWCVSNQRSYVLTDNNGHYIKRNGNNIENVNTIATATRWIFENEATKSGIIYDENATNYKLRINNNALSAGNTNTSWSNDGSNLYNGSNYIVYNGTAWTLYQPNQYYIKYGNYYLSLDNNGEIINNITDITQATIWTFSNVSSYPKGYVSTVINEKTYHLRNNNGTLTTVEGNTNRTNWNNDGEGLYNNNYYIQYKNNQWLLEVKAEPSYKISYNGNYLNATTSGLSAGNNSSTATTWYVDSSNNRIYFLNGTTKYYLYYSSWYYGTLSVTTSTNQDYYPTKTDNYLKTGNYYVTYNDRNWADTTTVTTLDFTDLTEFYAPSIIKSEIPYTTVASLIKSNFSTESSTTNTYSRNVKNEVPSMFTYIPLNSDPTNNNLVKNTNTGYIMSGGHSGSSGSLTGVDIRVAGAADAYNYSRIAASYNRNTNKITTAYTYDANGLHAINESTQKYQKYTVSKTSLETTLSQHESAIGGIHFIEALISKDKLVTAPKVVINGNTYTNYQMPEDSIDFNLKTKGYINFFATLYYPGSTTFFSLYDIKRDGNNNITEINHIKEIYENTNDKTQDFIYAYENGSYSNGSSLPEGYEKIFDTSWIETPTFVKENFESTETDDRYKNNGWYMTKIFYFEIPINKGEYALGSVADRDGGYLLYLDVGANAAAVDRTTITQETKTVVSDYKYVNGIQILADTGNITSISAANSAVAVIKPTSNVSEVSISRTGDTISFGTLNNNVLTPFTNNLDVSYKSEDISLSGAELKALEENETNKKVLKYLDYNRATESLYQTIINNNGTTNTDYEVYRLNPTTMEKTGDILDYNGMDINDRMNATYGLLMIDTTSSSVPAGKRVDNFTSVAITTSTNPAVLKYDLYTDTTNKNNVVETIDMVVTRVTGNQTVYNLDNNINDITVTNGRLTLSDNYLAEFLYRLQGNTITITSVEETTVTVKEINRANNTYTFIFKTYDGTTYEVTAVGNTVNIPASQ